ncbi:MAG: phosphoenolpyruvate--protein phosphotransferase [Caldilineaceae bacterium]
MVGIVLVCHSATLAAGVRELIDQMTRGQAPLALAAGTENPDEPLGADPQRVLQAIEAVYSADGVLVLMDLGSAVMSAEAAREMLEPARQARVYLCEAPLVEGGLAAAVAAAGGAAIDQVIAEARGALPAKFDHLAPVMRAAPGQELPVEGQIAHAPALRSLEVQPSLVQHFVAPNRLGLHARPAARLAQIAFAYDAEIRLRHGTREANARSINQLLMLGVRAGDDVQVTLQGPDAEAVWQALAALVATNLGDPADKVGQSEPPHPAQPVAPRMVTDAQRPSPLVGTAAAPGIALGPVVQFTAAPPVVTRRAVVDITGEQELFTAALSAVRQRLTSQERDLIAQDKADEAGILAAQALMLADPLLQKQVTTTIANQRVNAAWAWQQAIDHLVTDFAQINDAYLRQRAADLRDVGNQLLQILNGEPPVFPILTKPAILVAQEVAPSLAAALNPALVLGIITEVGGANGHSAILARSLGIPAVVGVANACTLLQTGQEIAMDGTAGKVWPAPDAVTKQQLEQARTTWLATQSQRNQVAQSPAMTRDGVRIEVAANIGRLDEVSQALMQGAEGVGLLRTELLFMAFSSLPDEDLQYALYTEAAQMLGDRPLLIRTLDIGGDKALPQLGMTAEANPFLGARGIRYCLHHEAIFRPQLRALLRAGVHGNVQILLPMVSTLEEVQQVKALIEAERANLAQAGYTVCEELPLGIMVETPAAVLNAAVLAQEVAFFSIGANDLTQYVMAADRGNAQVANLVNPLQPPVLRAMAQVVNAANAAGIWVGCCGEIAADPRATVLLLGLGIKELSMNPPAIPLIKERMHALTMEEAQTIARHALTLATVAEVEAYLAGVNSSH